MSSGATMLPNHPPERWGSTNAAKASRPPWPYTASDQAQNSTRQYAAPASSPENEPTGEEIDRHAARPPPSPAHTCRASRGAGLNSGMVRHPQRLRQPRRRPLPQQHFRRRRPHPSRRGIRLHLGIHPLLAPARVAQPRTRRRVVRHKPGRRPLHQRAPACHRSRPALPGPAQARRRRLGRGIGALFWALHPLRVESFAWIAERKDVLCALFFIATVLAYLRYAERPSKPRYLAWIGFAALALMSKPVAVSLAPILLLLDYWPLRRNSGPLQLLKEKLPLLGITAAVMALTVYGQKVCGSMSHLADVPFRIRLENVPVSCARYIGKILWPVNLSCFYAYDRHPAAVWVAACALGLCAVSALLVRKRRRRPWLLVGWIWFLVALLPNIGLLQAGRQSIADRFTNLAMIGIAIAAVFAVSEWVGVSRARGKAAAVSSCAALAVMAALTMRQIGFWHDSARLCQHAISVEDGDYVRALLGATLISEHRYQEAEPHLRIAVRLAPERAEHHNNLANVLLETGQLDEAAAQESIALRLAPNDVSVAETMGRIDFRQANYGGAVQQFSHAVELVFVNDTATT